MKPTTTGRLLSFLFPPTPATLTEVMYLQVCKIILVFVNLKTTSRMKTFNAAKMGVLPSVGITMVPSPSSTLSEPS